MSIEDKIKRINELYHKSVDVGLTPEEKEEQAMLRKEYIMSVRANLRSQMNNIDILEKDGTITNLGDKYAAKNGLQ
jgi:5-formyltetrahydrofolate cyclo-ligase